MCGIAGYYSDKPYDPSVLDNMVQALLHRGPDSAGFHRSGPFQGGMRRLSINGLMDGNQPLYSPDRSLVMFYNGEIYNYPQLKKELEAKGYTFRTGSDGEVISYLFEQMGPSCFERLDGMFGIALWSEKTKKLYLVRDIPGEKPLYYARLPGGGIAWGSELCALKKHPGLTLDLNRQAVWDFPTFLWVPEPETIYRDVFILPRGHYLEYDGRDAKIVKIENRFKPYTAEAGDSWADLVGKTRDLVTDVVKSRLLADVPVGAFLSSGLDSSIVDTIAQQELGNLTTFSIGFHADAVDPYEGHADESAEAAAYAKQIGATHHLLRVTADEFRDSLPAFIDHAGQPYAVSSGLGVMHVAKAARAHDIRILLSGDGADENFGGYGWYKHLNHPALQTPKPVDGIVSMHSMGMKTEEYLAAMGAYPGPLRAWAWHYYAAEGEKASLFNLDLAEGAESSVRVFERYKAGPDWQPIDFIRQDRQCYLPFEMMPKLDRMTMAHSVEGRAPLVAPAIMNFVEGLRFDHMVKGDTLKPLLREAFSGLLPESVWKRPKHGFRVPIDHWLKGEWNDLFEHTFSGDSKLSRMGMLGKGAQNTARHMLNDPHRVNGHTLFCYMMLNLWLERQAG